MARISNLMYNAPAFKSRLISMLIYSEILLLYNFYRYFFYPFKIWVS